MPYKDPKDFLKDKALHFDITTCKGCQGAASVPAHWSRLRGEGGGANRKAGMGGWGGGGGWGEKDR